MLVAISAEEKYRSICVGKGGVTVLLWRCMLLSCLLGHSMVVDVNVRVIFTSFISYLHFIRFFCQIETCS